MPEQVCHRPTGPRSFAGIGIHAAEGVHEGALAVLGRFVPHGACVADLGAGSGAFSARLRSAGYHPVAVDLSVEVRPEGIPFIEADVGDLRTVFEPNTLPAAVAIESMEHLRDPVGFLESVFEVLEPGGVFLATTPNVTHPYSRAKFAAKGTFWLFDTDLYRATGHITPLPEWLLRAHLVQAGFCDVEHGLVGRFDFRGVKRLGARALGWAVRRSHPPLGVTGDGSNVVIVARKPHAV